MPYTIQQIKLIAFNQSEPPNGMTMAEEILYFTLTGIYRRFRSGDISQAEGERLIRMASQKFNVNSAQLLLADRIISNNSNMWKRIESAAANYVMSGNRTPEADALMEAVYGCRLKE